MPRSLFWNLFLRTVSLSRAACLTPGLLLCLAGTLTGADPTGSIAGRVTDPTGAVVVCRYLQAVAGNAG